jgi:hypothetical protein
VEQYVGQISFGRAVTKPLPIKIIGDKEGGFRSSMLATCRLSPRVPTRNTSRVCGVCVIVRVVGCNTLPFWATAPADSRTFFVQSPRHKPKPILVSSQSHANFA